MTSSQSPSPQRFSLAELARVTQALFVAVGMDLEKARCVTDALLTADSMGHSTHGLALAPWYLEAARSGVMSVTGDKIVVNDRGACVTWNGNRLPGAWLIHQAIDAALERIEQYGVVMVVIANSHHTGALATYLPRLTERGLLVQLVNSGPAAAGVAPFGGTQALFTPNPIAAGIPTTGAPILLDISSSITTLNSARQLAARGERFPANWAMDAQGRPSDDPAVVISGGGTLLPVGGFDHGHKGYGMALLAEALTQGLPGHGRADAPVGTTIGIFLQVIDPNAFAGLDAFTRQTGWLADACHANPPLPGGPRVRLPGEQALVRQREAMEAGVPLAQGTVDALRLLAEGEGLQFPLLF
ncbi:Ldh family oxidoreductase [Rhodoferax ferrireducens]|uniref:Ldh family oxidoreductase n=1 Tax=Rhodoferax ferrireducens TaxID=192843 RepID=UPI000E0D1289|nr:Ldh family oxidoreductase [Rhodoferax ferrireducens]